MFYYFLIAICSAAWLAFLLMFLFLKRQFSLRLQRIEYVIGPQDIDLVVHALETYRTHGAKAYCSTDGDPLEIEMKPEGDRFNVSIPLHTSHLKGRREELMEIAAAHAELEMVSAADGRNHISFQTSCDHPRLEQVVSEFVRSLLHAPDLQTVKVVLFQRRMFQKFLLTSLDHRQTKDPNWIPGKGRTNSEQRSGYNQLNPANELFLIFLIAPVLHLAAYAIGGMNAVLMTTLVMTSVHVAVAWHRKAKQLGLHVINWTVVLALAIVMGSEGLRFLPSVAVLQFAAFLFREHQLKDGLFDKNSDLRNLGKPLRNAIAVAWFALALGLSEWMRLSQPDHVWIVYFAFIRIEIFVMLFSAFVPAAIVSAKAEANRV